MDQQHAVPQDITGFTFKLVGDMTLKQFGELAFGAVTAYIFYASGWHPFLKWPLVTFFGFLGVALAFFPIEERPLDVWIINFFRAIYRPTFYVWQKSSSSMGQMAVTAQRVMWPYQEESTALAQPIGPVTPPPPTAEPQKKVELKDDKKPSQTFSVEELMTLREQKSQPENFDLAQVTVPTAPPPPPKEGTEPSVLTVEQLVAMRQAKGAQQDQQHKEELSALEGKLVDLGNQQKGVLIRIDQVKSGLLAKPDDLGLQKELVDLTEEKNKLAGELTETRQKASSERVAPLSNPDYKVPKTAPQVRVVAKPIPQPATIALTDLPNVVNGQVADQGGRPIEGVILIIRDKNGNSIRALKTNKVGQFVVSTPLTSGTYLLELEKGGFNFDTLEVTLTGQVLSPIDIRAK